MNKPRSTFHLPASLYLSLEVGEKFELEFSEDRKGEQLNVRNRTNYMNIHHKPKHFKWTTKARKGWATVERTA